MFGYGVKNININNVNVQLEKDKWFDDNALVVNFDIDFTYKKQLVQHFKFSLNTYDADTFGFSWGLRDDHANKAEFLIDEFKKNTWFAKDLLKRYYKEYVRNSINTDKISNVLNKYKYIK